jgi:hypothetical protein
MAKKKEQIGTVKSIFDIKMRSKRQNHNHRLVLSQAEEEGFKRVAVTLSPSPSFEAAFEVGRRPWRPSSSRRVGRAAAPLTAAPVRSREPGARVVVPPLRIAGGEAFCNGSGSGYPALPPDWAGRRPLLGGRDRCRCRGAAGSSLR